MASIDLMQFDIQALATIQEWLREKKPDHRIVISGWNIRVFRYVESDILKKVIESDVAEFDSFSELAEWIKNHA